MRMVNFLTLQFVKLLPPIVSDTSFSAFSAFPTMVWTCLSSGSVGYISWCLAIIKRSSGVGGGGCKKKVKMKIYNYRVHYGEKVFAESWKRLFSIRKYVHRKSLNNENTFIKLAIMVLSQIKWIHFCEFFVIFTTILNNITYSRAGKIMCWLLCATVYLK